MHFHGITDPAQFKQAENILIPLGEFFQIQDDYIDCFTPPEILGKIGTDIIDNKNSWVVNTALLRANPEQRKVLDENYGRKDAACEARVKQIFREIGVETIYKEYEQTTQVKLVELISEIEEKPGQLKREVFLAFTRKIFGRHM